VAGPAWLVLHGWPSVAGHVHGPLQPAPSLSKALRRWFLMTCSVMPTILPISRSVRPVPEQDCDRNLFISFYLFRNLFRSKALAACHDCAPSFVNMAIAIFRRLRPSRIRARKNQEQRAQGLLHRAGRGADIEPARNLFVAAALLLQPCCCSPARASSRPAGRGGHFCLIQVDHVCPRSHSTIALVYSDSTAFANSSHLLLPAPKSFGV